MKQYKSSPLFFFLEYLFPWVSLDYLCELLLPVKLGIFWPLRLGLLLLLVGNFQTSVVGISLIACAALRPSHNAVRISATAP